ncbi:MAG: hypothetical protein GX640_03535 [Fibrobacter sp.]|nr:hypothetical protein [Fibrobacter sp.]
MFPIIIRKKSPGKGFHHFLGKKEIYTFLELLPRRDEVCYGLEQIVLAEGEKGCDGWYDGAVIAINAWEKDLWRVVPPDYYEVHRSIFNRLQVECIKTGPNYLCKFTQFSVKAFQLLHVFLHELGHHYDKMTTGSKREASRGEHFAEEYAVKNEEVIWEGYMKLHGL